MSRNLAASVRARLKQQADAGGENFDLVLTRFALERLLYRLSISTHADNFLLKGALLFSLWFEHPHRPTRDADLLGYGASDAASLVAKFREIVSISVDDGIQFDVRSVQAESIRKQDGYGGVRVDLRATLDGARIAVQVDIGFGDAVTPGPESVHYPVLLDDLPVPQLRAYPKYTAIAEKLHAICLLGMTNSRMKDYFDLWVLAQEPDIDAATLAKAIAATFARRGMDVPNAMPMGLTAMFAGDTVKQRQWAAFVGRNALQAPSLIEVVEHLVEFFERPLSMAHAAKT